MILSNQSILAAIEKGQLFISGFKPGHVQPAGYDLTLATDVLLWPCIFPWRKRLAVVHEAIFMPDDLQGEIFGRSSVARQFVMVHTVSGPLEPGWRGYLTLELVNLSWRFRRYYAGDRVAQVKFTPLDQPANPAYAGRYQDQGREPTPSRFEHGDD